ADEVGEDERRQRALGARDGIEGGAAARAEARVVGDLGAAARTGPGRRWHTTRRYSRHMRVTVLGKSPSWQDAGGACSGYLIEEAGTVLLLDCGNGVFAKLRERIDYTELDAVLLSHLHADHFLDVVPYAYALTYTPRQQPVPVPPWPGTEHPARPRLIAPTGASEMFRR